MKNKKDYPENCNIPVNFHNKILHLQDKKIILTIRDIPRKSNIITDFESITIFYRDGIINQPYKKCYTPNETHKL